MTAAWRRRFAGVSICLAALAGGSTAAAAQQPPDTTRGRAEIVALEHTWLHAQDAATLDRILAPDFVHPVASGVFLTKAQHIAWVVGHPRPASTQVGFESLTVRLYGDAAIANGIVVARPAAGSPVRTVFTDVFARRGGRWQAVNAQEDVVGGR